MSCHSFINVLRGEMNLVGPRPHPTCNTRLFEKRITFYGLRAADLPGNHRMGAGALRLREHAGGGDREDAVRPVLHQEPFVVARRPHRGRDDGHHAVGRRCHQGATPSAMSASGVIVEDQTLERGSGAGRGMERDGHVIDRPAMKIAALDVFVCPACRSDLRLHAASRAGPEVLEGSLTCTAAGRVYPITRGVPRFVPTGAYAQSFGHQWHWFREVQMDSLNRTSESEAALRATTGWHDDEYRGRRLLDAGVGAGRFAERAAAKGAEVFGIDLTPAIDAAYRNIGHLRNVHLAQADIFALPVRARHVRPRLLHRRPSSHARIRRPAFARVAETLAPGGKLAIYVLLALRTGASHVRRHSRRDDPPALETGLGDGGRGGAALLRSIGCRWSARRCRSRCRFRWSRTGAGGGWTPSTGTRRRTRRSTSIPKCFDGFATAGFDVVRPAGRSDSCVRRQAHAQRRDK